MIDFPSRATIAIPGLGYLKCQQFCKDKNANPTSSFRHLAPAYAVGHVTMSHSVRSAFKINTETSQSLFSEQSDGRPVEQIYI